MNPPSRQKSLAPLERGTYQRVPDFLEHWSPAAFAVASLATGLAIAVAGWLWWPVWLVGVPWLVLVARGVADVVQTQHALLRNFPLLGHLRYVLESLRPELRQYFVESDEERNPFSREERTVVYQRAKDAVDTQPFGTRDDVYAPGHEWIGHSLAPRRPTPDTARVTIGGPDCGKPYHASILNVSAMSYGSLSRNAIRALNEGARIGGFSHNTGEGGISPHHLAGGGDLVWQVGTGYFGCRTEGGGFDAGAFREKAALESVKMIELKLSQGAKPGHGGILPAAKITPEISEIRGVPMDADVLSPPAHSAFEGPLGLVEFVARLRDLAGGKPVGFKLCLGNPVEWLAIVRAMVDTGLTPDFITVDGSEGGTGAAPLEFLDSVGMPLVDALTLVHDTLVGAGLRDRLRLVSAGKIATGFHVVRQLALGADACNAARAMMFALGCIQALKCNTNTCPTGVATQDPRLVRGLVVTDKAHRVARFHEATVQAALELVGAAGLASPAALRRFHVVRRLDSGGVSDLGALYPGMPPGSLLEGSAPERITRLWELAASRVRPG